MASQVSELPKRPKTKPEEHASGQSDDAKFLDGVVRHIRLVQDNCLLLGKQLIEEGEPEMGIKLISNGLAHDQSKFTGIEWHDMRDNSQDDFAKALQQHILTNHHHPEHWGGVTNMPPVYIAEMVCDWYARSTEFGTDLRVWIKDHAVKKYDISLNGKVYKQIKRFVDMLLEKPFS